MEGAVRGQGHAPAASASRAAIGALHLRGRGLEGWGCGLKGWGLIGGLMGLEYGGYGAHGEGWRGIYGLLWGKVCERIRGGLWGVYGAGCRAGCEGYMGQSVGAMRWGRGV